ncbi:MAG: sulfotransferase [Kiritimatiellae bacterium]|nr:sulfotransferase [Kiritimatiellia bacterium]
MALGRKLLRLAFGNKVRVRMQTPWRHAPYESDARPIVIGGCGRSGTTLLRVILDSHPNICCGIESNLFLPRSIRPSVLERKFDMPAADVARLLDASGSQAEFIDRFFAAYCRQTGKPRWAEKTPDNVRVVDWIFDRFPEARFIHMLRDGRDAVCSLRTHPSHDIINGQRVALNTRQPLDYCIDRWVATVSMGLAYRDDPRCFEIKYEDITSDGETALKKLFQFLEEPWDPVVLDFHKQRNGSRDERKNPLHPGIHQPISRLSTGRWRKEMTKGDADEFKSRAGHLLVHLGYVVDNNWQPDE